MRVYVVEQSSWDGSFVCGVFSSLERAAAWVSTQPKLNPDYASHHVTWWDVDEEATTELGHEIRPFA